MVLDHQIQHETATHFPARDDSSGFRRIFHANQFSLPFNPSPRIQTEGILSNESAPFDFSRLQRSGHNASGGIEEELENLQQQLALIEALEQRNEAQLDSFVDEQDQWESLEPEEQDLLRSKDEIVERMDQITTEFLQLWMGAKSQDG